MLNSPLFFLILIDICEQLSVYSVNDSAKFGEMTIKYPHCPHFDAGHAVMAAVTHLATPVFNDIPISDWFLAISIEAGTE